MKSLRSLILVLLTTQLPMVASLFFLSTATQAQVQDDGSYVTWEGELVSNGGATGYGLRLDFAGHPTVILDLATNDWTWMFREGKAAAVSGFLKNVDNELRLIAEKVEPIINITGTLESAFGIGGETTGYVLRLSPKGPQIEIDLKKNGLTKEFIPGRVITVRGYMTIIEGVETVRRVLIVDKVIL